MLRTLIATAVLGAAGWLAYTRLKEQIMTAKDEILTQLADVKTLVTETSKDVQRVIAKLDEAVAAGNLDDVAAAVADLRTAVQGIDDAAEQASPEPAAEPEVPAEPEPGDLG